MITDQNGMPVGEFSKVDCPIGTELIGQAIQALIEKDDVVYKLTLNFLDDAFEKRIPYHEATPQVIKEQWTELLSLVFSYYKNGKQQREFFNQVTSNAKENLKDSKLSVVKS